jgi:hypothetical protein
MRIPETTMMDHWQRTKDPSDGLIESAAYLLVLTMQVLMMPRTSLMQT